VRRRAAERTQRTRGVSVAKIEGGEHRATRLECAHGLCDFLSRRAHVLLAVLGLQVDRLFDPPKNGLCGFVQRGLAWLEEASRDRRVLKFAGRDHRGTGGRLILRPRPQRVEVSLDVRLGFVRREPKQHLVYGARAPLVAAGGKPHGGCGKRRARGRAHDRFAEFAGLE
jgi:hypothetical protein